MTALGIGEQLDAHLSSSRPPSRVLASTARPLLRQQAESCFSEMYQYQHETERPSTPVSRPPSRWVDGSSTSLYTPRFRSITWSSWSPRKPRNLSRQKRPRADSGWNPPALDHVLERCLLKGVLDICSPSAEHSLGLGIRRRKESSGTAFRLKSVSTPVSSVPAAHSAASEPQSTPKFLLLSEDGYILQYCLGGDPQRIPERVLELGSSSIAVASDAIPGKHWVLSILQDREDGAFQKHSSLKALRPKLLSRNSASKPQVSEMLIVFDSAYVFNAWLITVRKEIEALGGLEYHPDSRGLDSELDRLESENTGIDSHKLPPGPFIHPSPSTTRSRKGSSDLSPSTSGTNISPSKRASGRPSETRSSVGTATELDGLRDSEVSDSASHRTGTRSSYADSVAAGLSSTPRPTPIDFPPEKMFRLRRTSEVDLRSRRKKNVPIDIIVKPDGRERSTSCSPALPSPHFPRTPTLAPDAVHHMLGKFVDDEPHSQRSPVGAAKMAHWLEKLTVEKELAQSPLCATHTEEPAKTDCLTHDSDPDAEVMHFENFEFSRESSESTTPRIGAGQTSFLEPTNTEPPAKPEDQLKPPAYSLAPQRKSSLDFMKKRRSAGDPVSLSTAVLRTTTMNSPTQEAFPVPNSVRTESPIREVQNLCNRHIASPHKNFSIQYNKSFAAIDRIHEPERSPAVTDAHFATCFGVETPSHKQSVQVEGDSVDFPLAANSLGGVLQFAISQPPTTGTIPEPKAFRKHHIKRQQSMPTIIYRSAAPLSPPPSAPLPAVPTSSSLIDLSSTPCRLRARSVTPMSLLSRMEEPRHIRSATVDCLNRECMSPLSSNPPTPVEVRYAKRLSSTSLTIPSKPHSRPSSLSGSNRKSSASAIAAVAAQLQKMTTPLPTPSPPRTRPASVSLAGPAYIDSIDSIVSSTTITAPAAAAAVSSGVRLTAVPGMEERMEINGYPFPLVISSVNN